MKVMVVDDALTARLKISSLLAEIGYAGVLMAADGSEALRLLEGGERPELVFVDWHMPEMGGLELIQQLRARAEYADTKLIMVTSETGMKTMVQALDAGADEYMMKPFNREILLEKLQLLGVRA